MTDALIFDTVRTPRGKGKKDGTLHEVPAVDLASQMLGQLKERNDLPEDVVDDVVMQLA